MNAEQEIPLEISIPKAKAWLKTFPVIAEQKPLVIGIIHQILAQEHDGLSNNSIRRALSWIVDDYGYHRNVVNGDTRYNLDGTAASNIRQRERDYSAKVLRQNTKGSLRIQLKNLRETLPMLSYLEGENLELALSVFKHHPNFKVKTQGGIKGIYLSTDEFKQRCFFIETLEGARDSISINKAFNAM